MNRDDDDLHARIGRKWNQKEPEEVEEAEEIEEVKRPRRRIDEDEDEDVRSFRRRLPSRDDDEEDRPRRKKKRKKGNKQLRRTLLLALLFGGGLLVIVVILFLVLRPRDRIGPFKDQMTDYLTGPVKGNAPPNTPLKGKMVVVSNQAKGLDDVHFTLAASVKAETPEEVKIVVRVSSDPVQVGKYSNGAPGFKHVWTAQVIDWTTRLVVDTRRFEGSMPPQTIHTKSTSAVYGSDPKSDVVSYLNGLPKQ